MGIDDVKGIGTRAHSARVNKGRTRATESIKSGLMRIYGARWGLVNAGGTEKWCSRPFAPRARLILQRIAAQIEASSAKWQRRTISAAARLQAHTRCDRPAVLVPRGGPRSPPRNDGAHHR